MALISTEVAFTGHFFNINYDGIFHISRMENIYQALIKGHLPSSTAFIGLGNKGIAVNAMYPWLSTLIFIFPRIFGMSPFVSLYVGFFIMNFVTIVAVYKLMKKISNNRGAICVGIFLYQFNAYHFELMYSRVALGEALCYMVAPFVVYGVLLIWQKDRLGVLWLGLGMSVIANSHILSLVMFSTSILLIELIRLLLRKVSIEEIKYLIISAILTFFMALYSLYNVINWMLHNKMVSPILSIIPVDPQKYFTATVLNNFKESSSPTMGAAITFALIFMLFMVIKNNMGSWRYWIVGSVSIFLISLNWFPWRLLAETPLNIFQFTMRLYALVAISLAVGVTIFLTYKKFENTLGVVVVCVLTMSIAIFGTLTNHGAKGITGSGNGIYLLKKDTYRALVYKSKSFSNTFDYFLKKDGHSVKGTRADYMNRAKSYELTKKTVLYDTKTDGFKVVSSGYNNVTLKKTTKKDGEQLLPIIAYHNVEYTEILNGKRTKLIKKNGQLMTQLKEGENLIYISTTERNSLRMISMLVTIFMNLIIVGYLVFISISLKK